MDPFSADWSARSSSHRRLLFAHRHNPNDHHNNRSLATLRRPQTQKPNRLWAKLLACSLPEKCCHVAMLQCGPISIYHRRPPLRTSDRLIGARAPISNQQPAISEQISLSSEPSFTSEELGSFALALFHLTSTTFSSLNHQWN